MTSAAACPRCGGDFRCGAADAAPCACTTVSLDAAMLAQLRAQYTGCLCLACLRKLAAQTSCDQSRPASAQAPMSGITPTL
jgi:hypothetical protein